MCIFLNFKYLSKLINIPIKHHNVATVLPLMFPYGKLTISYNIHLTFKVDDYHDLNS